ncbi:MAG: DUF6796 family protein [Cocleimonas sp.]
MSEKTVLITTGLIGLLAAVLVGLGEFLLHFDPQARFASGGFDFMMAASTERQTLGHFIGTLAAPLYIIGAWHIYLMLKPANQKLAFFAFLVTSYGFIIGGDWISSRASIGSITHLAFSNEFSASKELLQPLTDLYIQRNESLLTVIRITTLILSGIIAYLAWGGKSHYSKIVSFFNPLVLLIFNFVVFVISPEIGKYMMPIALNIGFGLFFILSLYHVKKLK